MQPVVLIAVDIQNAFVGAQSRHVLEPLESLQYDFDEVIFTKFHNADPSTFRKFLNHCHLTPDSPETQLAIEAREDAVIIERPSLSCVTPQLRDRLKLWAVDEVFVCGLETETCVIKTVLDLVDHNIRPWVLQDLCASDKNPDLHDMALQLIGNLIGPQHLITSEIFASNRSSAVGE